MTQKKLNDILKLHQKWLNNEKGGKRADLSYADLSYADLSYVDLYNANLFGADLSNADLSKADLSEADLSGADLSGADLSGADLSYAILNDVITDENTKYFNLRCPVEGSFVGYKKCMYDVIVTLKITEDALRSSATGDKCRCSKAEVINIEGAEEAISWYDSNFIYHKGDIVEVKDFNQNRWIECAPGIHFFMTKEEAIAFIF
ncbi:pentapeptide repeat-containing protein [bacterium]|jgi:uncharacterized protein YjbI with pentapeptide repeats|nr:pentapeptide repeat-containing protein [bacterium]